MKLFISPASPYVRKCRIVIREKGLEARVDEIGAVPVENPPELNAANPLSQIPALVSDDGVSYIDSPLICAWLDTQGSGVRLIPDSGPDHWRVRRIEALADGILEMTVKRVLELRRPVEERSPSWLQRWADNIVRAAEVANQAAWKDDDFDMGTLSLAVAMTYLKYRFPDIAARITAPRLQALTDRLEQRNSFKATVPA